MSFATLIKRGVVAGAAIVAVGGTSIFTTRQSNPGFDRACTFWTQVFPIYMEYRVVQLRYKNIDEVKYRASLDALHERYADEALAIVLSLRGLFIKVGQLASMRDDVMPETYLKRFRRLQYDVPGAPIEYVRGVIEAELGRPFDDVFLSIDEVPLGSASIGQVHAATLRDPPGEEVCVKVQYPEVEQQFAWDFSVIADFIRLAMPEHLPFLGEIERTSVAEFDYIDEAKNLLDVRRNMSLAGFDDQVVVPYPKLSLCSKHVLVMQRLRGITIIDAFRNRMREMATAQGCTLEDIESEVRLTGSVQAVVSGSCVGGHDHEDGRFEAVGDDGRDISSASTSSRSIFGNASRLALARWLIWGRDGSMNLSRSVYNWTCGWVYPPLQHRWSVESTLLDISKVVDLVWHVHGHQLLLDGVFNADPHPGNLLVLDDGRIGLIDYGQVKRIDNETRLKIAKLIVALCDDDSERIVACQINNGMRTRDMDPYVLEAHARIAFDGQDESITNGMEIQDFASMLDDRDPVTQGDDDLVMATRMVMMLMGISYALKLNVRICKKLEHQARLALVDEDTPNG
eukprot:m.38561 g.38561  ORF g.38561 m.38561 type:complete len:570 (-) comp17941_c1_seq1:118-1827(-)